MQSETESSSPTHDPAAAVTADLVVTRLLTNAIRCREVGGDAITLRRMPPHGLVAGMRLTVVPERRWTWRTVPMLAGTVLHSGFSLRALQHAGFALADWTPDRLRSPGDDDPRMAEALGLLEDGRWVEARSRLWDVLEATPANMPAHATLGELHARFEHRETAAAHFTAVIRLGLGAITREGCLPLDPARAAEIALLRSLRGRGILHAAEGRLDAAALDLRRALDWDPTDAAGCGPLLGEVEMAMPGTVEASCPSGGS